MYIILQRKGITLVRSQCTDIIGVPFSLAVVWVCLSLFLSSDHPVGKSGGHL